MNMGKIWTTIILTIALFMFYPFTPAMAQDKPEKTYDKVIIYMVDNLALNDINPDTTPFLWQNQKNWGIGLLNTSSAKNRTVKNACATLSAGKPALGSNYSQLNFNASELINGEKAGDIFFRNTGLKPDMENVVVISIISVKDINAEQNTGEVGILGEKIKAQGYATLVAGNADRVGYHVRLAPVILMDKRGLVDKGSIDKSTNTADPELPSLIWTDYSSLEKQVKGIKGKTVALIEYGDLYRLESMASLFSPAEYSQKRQEILRKIDNSIASIEKSQQGNTASYIINLSPSRQGNDPEALLMPVFIKKAGYKGLLQSFSTRREVVTLENLHLSILNSVGAETEDPLYTEKNQFPIQELKRINQQAAFNFANQAPALATYALLAVLALFLAILYLSRKKSEKNILILLSFPLAIPAVLLIMPLFRIHNLFLFILLSLVLAAFLVSASLILHSTAGINPLLTIAALNILLIILDTLLGFNLVKNCIMSYQLINGIRYYGIGNEYMGILIGSAITFSVLSTTGYPARICQILSAILFAVTIFVLAFPRLGINFGGTITACVALTYAWLNINKLDKKHPIKTKNAAIIMLITLMVISAMIIVDLKQPAAMQSHIGKSIRAIMEGGWLAFTNIIHSKMLLHLRVINYAKLGWLFLALLTAAAVIILKPSPVSKNLKQTDPLIFIGIQSLLLGAITALIFNDSGIIPASYLLWFAATLFIYTKATKKEEV